jgi:xylitol oxidase
VWLKRRIPTGAAADGGLRTILDLAGAQPATRDLHPISGFPAEACTPQLGVPGPWHERLPHFRLSHTPSSGDELQSEYFVDRESIVPAFEALQAIREALAPLVQVSEIRTVAQDRLWLSPAHERASATIHFTWVPDAVAVMAMLPRVERALWPYEPRAHWAKLSALSVETVSAAYPRLPEFAAVAAAVDPDGKFLNDRLRPFFGANGANLHQGP